MSQSNTSTGGSSAPPWRAVLTTLKPAARWVSRHPNQLVALTFAVVIFVAVAVTLATWRTLQSRRSYMALPTSSFDPSSEEVARFAHVLARTRRTVRGLSSRKAEAVRFRLTTDDRGRVVQYVEGTPRALALVDAGLPAEVELKEAPKEDQ